MTDRTEAIRTLGSLIKDVRIAMLTTIAGDGGLVSRPLGTQEVEFDGDLWFITGRDSGKVAEIQANPQVNVSYASTDENTYVSVAGRASIVEDPGKLEAIWSPAMKAFFPEGKHDPNLCLIRVEADSAEYWNGPESFAGKAAYLVLAAATNDRGVLSTNARVRL